MTNKGTTSASYKFAVAAATGFAIPYGVTLKLYSGNASSRARRPALVITYTIP
mgnify:CR=1 FL=1